MRGATARTVTGLSAQFPKIVAFGPRLPVAAPAPVACDRRSRPAVLNQGGSLMPPSLILIPDIYIPARGPEIFEVPWVPSGA